jgi:hypothetical protein
MAGWKDLIEKLEEMLSNGKQQKIDLLEFMQSSQLLFDECKVCLESGTAREKEEMLKDLLAVQQILEKDVESLAKESGKSAEQLQAYVENPDNFSQDAWQVMQKTWRRITSIKLKKKKSSHERR